MTSRRLILLVIGVILAANLVFYFPIVKMFALTAAGRSSCSLKQTVAGVRYKLNVGKARGRLSGQSRLIDSGLDGLHAWNTPHRTFWMPARSSGYITLQLAEEENHLYGSGDWAVRAGDIVLDCGANLGIFTHTALQAGARLVVAIEPAPDNVAALRRTFAKEIADGRVIVYPKGVWDKDDVLTLNGGGSSLDDSVVFAGAGGKRGVEVPLTTIDKLAAELKLPRADFIKMDIEGAERQALDGARGTIAAFRPRLAIATEHLPDDPEQIPVIVRGLWAGYRMECGPCYLMHGRVAPDVQYYR